MIPVDGQVGQFARATMRRVQHSHAHTDEHDHDHEGHGHAHGHHHAANERSVGLAGLLTGGFMFAEIVGAFQVRSRRFVDADS